uniref:Uncharacterized protein n=1 Tax=Salmonella sp. 96A-29192 TaxID=1179814 RepID=I3VZL3_9ENTR|nr:hypothetical protein [Salmonella sp. 96A-29192]
MQQTTVEIRYLYPSTNTLTKQPKNIFLNQESIWRLNQYRKRLQEKKI